MPPGSPPGKCSRKPVQVQFLAPVALVNHLTKHTSLQFSHVVAVQRQRSTQLLHDLLSALFLPGSMIFLTLIDL